MIKKVLLIFGLRRIPSLKNSQMYARTIFCRFSWKFYFVRNVIRIVSFKILLTFFQNFLWNSENRHIFSKCSNPFSSNYYHKLVSCGKRKTLLKEFLPKRIYAQNFAKYNIFGVEGGIKTECNFVSKIYWETLS